MEHARLNPSGADRWLNCAGSVNAVYGAADESNIYARTGTAAHELLEICLRFGTAPEDFHDMTLNGILVDDDMSGAVGQALDWVRSYTAKNPSALVRVERRVYPGRVFGRQDCWGTSDITITAPKELVVIDYKHGAGNAVDAVSNNQMLLYVVGVLEELKLIRALMAKKLNRKIRLVIIQPRARHEAGPVREWTVSPAQLISFIERAEQAAKATDDPKAPRKAGEWCRWCRVRKSCKTVAEFNLRLAIDSFTDLDADQQNLPTRAPLSVPGDMTMKQLGHVLKYRKMVQNWWEEIEAHAKELLRSGQEVDGWKLVQGRRQRYWNASEEDVLERLQEAGLSLDDAAPRELLSVAQAEKRLKKATPADLIGVNFAEPSLVPADDPRKALTSASSDFDEL